VVVTPTPPATSPPTTAAVTGLTNGTSYEFTVQATNSVGTSPASAPSNVVTPAAPTVPAAPTGVSAVAGNAAANVAWTPPANGGSPITSFTVTALVNGVPSGVTATAPGSATGATVTGLTNGTTYTFTVHATNAVGNGPESAQSNAVTPSQALGVPDISVSLSGPASVPTGSNVTYTATVTNPASSVNSAPQVVLQVNLPVSGVTFLSSTTTQGVCSTVGATVTCNLGAMAPSTTATVTVTVNVTSAAGTAITIGSSVSENDANGNPLTDPNPANNTSSVTTNVVSQTPPTTTDIQVTGSSNNGGPRAGTAFVYTWQVNNGGNQVANAVSFQNNLPNQIVFQSVSISSQGTLGAGCSGPPVGAAGGTISCDVGTLGVGQHAVITVNVTAGPTTGTVSTTGSATFNGTDTNTANNSFTVTVNIQ
jgi:titin